MRLVALMLSLFMFGCAADSKREAPVAVDGVMDLSDWDFERDGPVDLIGDVGVVDGELLSPSSSDSWARQVTEFTSIPDVGKIPASDSSAARLAKTYVITINLPPEARGLLLSTPGVIGAVKTQILGMEGEVVDASLVGRPSVIASEVRHAHYSRELLSIPKELGRVRVSAFVASQDHALGGIWTPAAIGLRADLVNEHDSTVFRRGILIGLTLILALYHIGIFYFRRTDYASFWFAMFCGAVAFRELMTSSILYDVLAPYSDDPYRWTVSFEYLSLPLSVTGYFFFTSLFKGGFSKKLGQGLGLSALALIAFSIFGSTVLVTSFKSLYQLHAVTGLSIAFVYLVMISARGRAYARVVLAMFILFFVAVINDILYSNDVIATMFVIPYAAVLFMLVNSAVVAKKFSNAMDERDAKNQELLSTYQQLDDELLKRENLEASNQALARENEIAAQQLIQADKLATMGTMVAGVAHDIANPTSLIQGSTVLMEETRDTLRTTVLALFEGDSSPESLKLQSDLNGLFDDLDRSTRDVMLGADRIKAINSAIRNQARSDQGHSSVALGELIDECLTVVSHRLKGIGMDVRVPEDFKVELIRSQFGQVLMNLLSNAADAIVDSGAKADGKIRVEVEALAGGRFALSIDDNGPGVPAELRAKILEPFFTTKGVGKGTGLGMPIVLRILDNHGMKLEILDAPELGGARFRMSPVEA